MHQQTILQYQLDESLLSSSSISSSSESKSDTNNLATKPKRELIPLEVNESTGVVSGSSLLKSLKYFEDEDVKSVDMIQLLCELQLIIPINNNQVIRSITKRTRDKLDQVLSSLTTTTPTDEKKDPEASTKMTLQEIESEQFFIPPLLAKDDMQLPFQSITTEQIQRGSAISMLIEFVRNGSGKFGMGMMSALIGMLRYVRLQRPLPLQQQEQQRNQQSEWMCVMGAKPRWIKNHKEEEAKEKKEGYEVIDPVLRVSRHEFTLVYEDAESGGTLVRARFKFDAAISRVLRVELIVDRSVRGKANEVTALTLYQRVHECVEKALNPHHDRSESSPEESIQVRWLCNGCAINSKGAESDNKQQHQCAALSLKDEDEELTELCARSYQARGCAYKIIIQQQQGSDHQTEKTKEDPRITVDPDNNAEYIQLVEKENKLVNAGRFTCPER